MHKSQCEDLIEFDTFFRNYGKEDKKNKPVTFNDSDDDFSLVNMPMPMD